MSQPPELPTLATGIENAGAASGWASADRPRWTIREIGIGLGVLLVWRCTAFLNYDWIEAIPLWVRLALALSFTAFLVAYPLILAKRRGFAAAYAWPAPRKMLVEAGLAVPIVIGVFILLAGFSRVLRLVSPQTSVTPEIWQHVASSPLTPYLSLILIYAFTLAPVSEEIFFRGFLHNALKSRLPLVFAGLIQSLIFAALHFYGPMHVAIVFFLGLILTAVYEWRKTLLAPIFVHTGVNLVSVLGIFLLMAANANRPVLGVETRDRPDGCLVVSVQADSAAEKAGLAAGDVITDLDGRPVAGIAQLQEALRRHRAGDAVVVGFTRSGAHMELRAILQKPQQSKPAP